MSAVRLTVTLSAVFLILLLGSGLYIVRSIETGIRQQIDEELLQVHQFLSDDFPTADTLIDWLSHDDEAALFGPAYQSASGQIYGPLAPQIFDKLGFSTQSAGQMFPPSGQRPANTAGLADADALFDAIHDDEDLWRIYVADFDGGRLAYFEPIDAVEDTLVLVPQIIAIVGLPIILTTLLAGLVLGWRQQKRLDVIRAGIDRIANGNLDNRLNPDPIRDDLDHVMQGIDAAAGKLERSFSQLRTLSHNFAHELRTPLALLRAELEDLDDSDQKHAALAQTDHVIRVFDAVQRIGRLSNSKAQPAFAPVDLAGIARLMDEIYGPVCADNGQTLRVEAPPSSVVQGDEQLVAQMTSNLVENALKHAGPGARIDITVGPDQLRVADSGQGVPPDQIDRLFNPFERLATDRRGSGLGLSLVRAIADYHGASLSAGQNHDAGFAVTIQFPTAKD